MNTNFDLAAFAPFIGIASKYLTGWIRSNPKINLIDGSSKKKVIMVTTVICTIGTVVTAVLTGNITTDIVSSSLETILSVVLSTGMAIGFHETTK